MQMHLIKPISNVWQLEVAGRWLATQNADQEISHPQHIFQLKAR